jgi:hypothetical protein
MPYTGGIWLLRAPFLICLILYAASWAIIPWANAHQPAESVSATTREQDAGTLQQGWLTRLIAQSSAPRQEQAAGDGRPNAVTPMIASATLTIMTARVVRLTGWIGTLGVLVMAGEVALTIVAMRRQRRAYPTMPTTYLLVRGQPPQAGQLSGRMAGSSTPSGDQFYRAIQQSIPRGSWWDRLSGTAPWVSFTLTGIPDQPIELGVVIADHDTLRRRDTEMQIRAIIQGQCPGAQLDEVADAFTSALTPGVTAVWQEYGLALAPHYPLRFLDDIEGSDLLGPLVNILRPTGALRTEFQLILRPANTWVLNRGWRGKATALKLTLEAKNDYALSEDTKTIEAKLDAAPFEAALRVCVVAEGPAAIAQITAVLNQVSGTLGQYHQRTSHHLQRLVRLGQDRAVIGRNQTPLVIHTRAPRFAPLPAFLLPVQVWRLPELLTSIELAGFWHPPIGGLGSAVRWLNSKYIPAPAKAFTNGDPERVQLGNAHHADGRIAPVGPTWRDLREMLHITAGMGAGKTRLLLNICIQAIRRGLMLLDGKADDLDGSLVARVRQQIPLADEHRIVIIDMLDTRWPIGLNPLAGIDFAAPGAKDQALGQLMAIFSRIDPGWSTAPGMQEYVLNGALLVFEGQANPTLAHIKQALLDEDYHTRLLQHCTNPEVRTFWTVEFPEHGEKSKQSLQALMRRFAKLLTSETTRYMVSQPTPRLDLLQAIEGGKIVLCPMPHQRLGSLAGATGMLLIQAILRAAMLRPGDDNSRQTFPLIIDELQIFIGEDEKNKDMETATSQLRGYGIAGIYAHQTISQLGPLTNEMLTNSGSRIVLRTQEPDASAYAKMYADKGITAADIAGQDPEEHQYADLTCHRKKTTIFSMITLGWPAPLELTVPTYDGAPWQTLTPEGPATRAFDTALLEIVYGTLPNPDLMAASLARQSDAAWAQLLDRWAAIRDYQLQYILDHPGCIPDRFERQQWISRLGYATPHILAEAEYARIRRAIDPAGSEPTVHGDEGQGHLQTQTSEARGEAKGKSEAKPEEEDARGHMAVHDVAREQRTAPHAEVPHHDKDDAGDEGEDEAYL